MRATKASKAVCAPAMTWAKVCRRIRKHLCGQQVQATPKSSQDNFTTLMLRFTAVSSYHRPADLE